MVMLVITIQMFYFILLFIFESIMEQTNDIYKNLASSFTGQSIHLNEKYQLNHIQAMIK